MTEEEKLKIDPNTADEIALQQLPGIGPSLAKRIVDSRPYSTLDDLENIRGIGGSVLKRIGPMLVFEESLDRAEPGEEEEMEEVEEYSEKKPGVDIDPMLLSPDGQRDEDVKFSQPLDDTKIDAEAIAAEVVEKKAEEPPHPEVVKKPRLVRAFSRTETIWLVIGAGVLSLIFSVLLSMVILGGINGTLDFNQLQGLQQLENDVGVLENDLVNLSSSLDAFDQRLTPLEGLTGRMTSVEDLTETLQSDVEEALVSVEAMRSDLESLSDETARLSGRVDRFDTFLDGLHRLINELFAAPSTESLPES